jgi:hypothetical protein
MGRKSCRLEDKKEKACNAKILNEFHVTVMILMDSGLHTLHDVLDKDNSRHQSIGTNHLFMLP